MEVVPKCTETVERKMVAKDQGGSRGWELAFDGYRVSVLQDKNINSLRESYSTEGEEEGYF